MSISHLKKNAIHNILGWLLPTIIFLALTPIMIRELGIEGFGVITLIQVITGYMTVLNFGFSEAIIKQIAENMESDKKQAMRVMWAGLALFSVFGGIGALTLFLLADWLGADILNIPIKLQSESILALKIGAPIFLLQMIAEFYRGASIGCHRFDIPNISRIIRISISGILILVSLKLSGGLAGVMAATLAGLIIGLVLNIFWTQKVFPLHYVEGPYRPVLMELFHFSKHIFFTRLAGMLSSRVNEFLLGTLSSIGNVALYSVPNRAAETGSIMINRVLQVFYPSFSALDKVTDKQRMTNTMFSVLSIQLFISTPLLLMAVLEGPSLLAVWIDIEFAQNAAHIITLLLLTYFISSFTNLPTFVAMSFNYPAIISKYSAIQTVVTLIIAYPLVKVYGLSGAAWVLFISSLFGIPFIYECIKRAFNLNPYATLILPLTVHAAIGILLYLLYVYIFKNSPWYTPLGACGVGVIHFYCARYFNAINKEDYRKLFKLIMVWR